MSQHLLLFYKGDISALTLFCQQADGQLCFPPLPKLATPSDSQQPPQNAVELFPLGLVDNVNRQLQLDDDLLAVESGFYFPVETADGQAMIYLARFNVLDPPHELLAQRQCKLQPLTALMGGSPVEMELLRQAYTYLMES